MENIILGSDSGVITNGPNKNGEIIYNINSLYPLKKFFLRSSPRIVNDKINNNYIEALYSIDGVKYKRIYK